MFVEEIIAFIEEETKELQIIEECETITIEEFENSLEMFEYQLEEEINIEQEILLIEELET